MSCTFKLKKKAHCNFFMDNKGMGLNLNIGADAATLKNVMNADAHR